MLHTMLCLWARCAVQDGHPNDSESGSDESDEDTINDNKVRLNEDVTCN